MVAQRESYVDKVWINLFERASLDPNGKRRQFWVECAIRCSRLNATQRAVALAINFRIGRRARAWPSVRRIMADTALGRSAVLEALKDLCRLGWLIRDSGQLKGAPNVYSALGPRDKRQLVEPAPYKKIVTRENMDPSI